MPSWLHRLPRPHLTLRRLDREQALIERLHAAHGARLRMDDLARDLRVSPRTIARDLERLRLSGVPLRTDRGNGGGVSLPRTRTTITVTPELPEAAAALSSLAALGPTTGPGAGSAMRKLTAALAA